MKIILTNGQRITVEEHTFAGMVGEPITALKLIDENGQEVILSDVRKLMSVEDAYAINVRLSELSEINNANAITWIY